MFRDNDKQRGNISSKFSSNSEAFASELLQNIKEMFFRYVINNDVLSAS